MIKVLLATLTALFLTACTGVIVSRPVPDPQLSSRDVELLKQAPQFKHDGTHNRLDVPYVTKEKVGTIIIDTDLYKLYHILPHGRAIEYSVTVGAEAFGWTGETYIARKAEWPSWTPPPEMLKRWPHLPHFFAGGPKNPLGARALYMYRDGKDTLYRIHGTNEPELIGTASSSGCIRMLNIDAIHLFERVAVGTKVIVK